LGGLNQTSLRKIIAFSSINHLGWILAAITYREIMWLNYFLIYTYLSFTLIFLFHSYNLFHLTQIFSFFNETPLIKYITFTSLLSLGGLPPFIGFLPKWLVIQSLSSTNSIFLLFVIVIFTLVTLFFYIRLTYSAFSLRYSEPKWAYRNITVSKTIKKTLLINFFSITSLSLISLIYIFM
jgi:NADH-ubiquinone oxidoreductase chain 2